MNVLLTLTRGTSHVTDRGVGVAIAATYLSICDTAGEMIAGAVDCILSECTRLFARSSHSRTV